MCRAIVAQDLILLKSISELEFALEDDALFVASAISFSNPEMQGKLLSVSGIVVIKFGYCIKNYGKAEPFFFCSPLQYIFKKHGTSIKHGVAIYSDLAFFAITENSFNFKFMQLIFLASCSN
jgi:hypothetical protein